MTVSKTPVDQAVELFVYAPVGLALAVRDLLPGLVERGRDQVTAQVSSARLVGRYAVKLGGKEARKALGHARAQAEQALGGFLGSPPAPPPRRPPVAPPQVTRPPVAPPPVVSRPAGAPPAVSRPPAPNGAAADPSSLAIPGYDSLSASQVVQRLGGLAVDELEAVRAYEESRRRRKTVLARVAQLQAAAGA